MTPLAIDIIVKATVLLAAAMVAEGAAARRASAATRHFLWSLAIATLLLLPLAESALPRWQVRIPVASAAGAVTDTIASTPMSVPPATPAAPGAAALPAAAPAPVAPLPRLAATLPIVYLFGALILLVRLAREPLVLARLTRGATVVTDPAWHSLLAACRRQLRVTRSVHLLQSADDVMPMTFRTIAPVILLPASADGWSAERRRAVLLHELAHVARLDCLTQRLTAIACAFYWPHPGVWWAARRLRVERELACDDRVLAAGAGAREYAGHLLDLAHSLRGAPAPATAIGMARARQLEQRLLAILDAARNRASLRGPALTIAFTLTLFMFVPLAALRAALVPSGSADADAPVLAAPAQDSLGGTWELRPAGQPGMVNVSIRTARGSHGRTIPVSRLEALTGISLTAATPTVHFPIKREAGTFTVDGVCRNGLCAGTFAFEPDAAFAGELVRRGIGRPTAQEQFDLAIADVGVPFIDALAAAGYAKPDLAALVRAAQHGVGLDYLRDMTALGYRLGTIDALVRLRDHGVDPGYVRGMADNGFARLSADDLVRTRDHGVDPGYIHGLAALGYGGLTLDTLVNARDHGVDPGYVTGLAAAGITKLSLDELVRTRDHGVDPSYIRGLAALGYGGLSVDALVNARDHGVDPGYARDLAALGYKGVPLDDLIRMRDHGVDANYVRRLQQRGVSGLGVDEIIRRRDRGEGG